MRSWKIAPMLCTAWVVVACGGGGNGGGSGLLPISLKQSSAVVDSEVKALDTVAQLPARGADSAPPTASAGRGSLIVSPPALLQRLSADEFSLRLEEHPALKQVLMGFPAITGKSAVACGIDLRELEYRTGDEKGAIINANGVVMIPTGASPMCQGPRPIALYAHGTWFTRDYTFTKLTDPTQPAAAEGMLVAAVFASRGYIVVAPNLAGYGKSNLPYHPYLNGDQQGKDLVDALTAARKALPEIGGKDSGKLLVTGISQGGYVAMAAHRELQATGQSITASAPISAPSAISLLIDHNFQGLTSNGATPFIPLLTTSWQTQFGSLYADPGEIYEARYASGIEALMPSNQPTLNDVITSGKLPAYEFFPESDKPSVPNPWFKQSGDANLIKGTYIRAVLEDIRSNSCPGNTLAPLSDLPELAETYVDYRLSGAKEVVDRIQTATGVDLTTLGSIAAIMRWIENPPWLVGVALSAGFGTDLPAIKRTMVQYAPLIESAVLHMNAGKKFKLPSEEVNGSAANPGASTPLQCQPRNAMRKAALANDLRDWTPQRPVLMCGGGLDATVSFRSTLATAAYFRANGMPDDKLKVIDLEATPAPGDSFAFAHTGFRLASAINWNILNPVTAREKSQKTLDGYHYLLVSPPCLLAARSFFESHADTN
ncbi:S9 family peptidase [Variovorax sp. EL159]|uniref:alpha/beta hydrolase family protein n=1 Tax=Variovorax sp. EL159 TaxID=1566270 RepID=UPI0008884861|nr:alpha/beta fold hydrolase [Variovorax sp. EL159]SCX74139.1 Prolyl oligopeptidase family protein [Variovorax sp. EL159]